MRGVYLLQPNPPQGEEREIAALVGPGIYLNCATQGLMPPRSSAEEECQPPGHLTP